MSRSGEMSQAAYDNGGLTIRRKPVEFFRGAPTLDAATGEWRRPWVFRMTLGHSRHGYEEAVWDP